MKIMVNIRFHTTRYNNNPFRLLPDANLSNAHLDILFLSHDTLFFFICFTQVVENYAALTTEAECPLSYFAGFPSAPHWGG